MTVLYIAKLLQSYIGSRHNYNNIALVFMQVAMILMRTFSKGVSKYHGIHPYIDTLFYMLQDVAHVLWTVLYWLGVAQSVPGHLHLFATMATFISSCFTSVLHVLVSRNSPASFMLLLARTTMFCRA